jgi:DNA-binding PadR family transcriptional regulator
MPKRRGESLFAIEYEILSAALAISVASPVEFYGYQLLKELTKGRLSPLGHGTLYRALLRLESLGFLKSRLESHDAPDLALRPRRRMYEITVAGARAVVQQAENAGAPSVARATR